MPVSPLNSAGTPPSALPSQFSKMSSEDFVRIIFTELSHQDPFSPNDSQALLNQLDSIRSIESDIKLTDQLQHLVSQNQLAAASNMIGKFVGGLTQENLRVAGFVVAVVRAGNTINVELDNGWVVPIDNVEQVIDVSDPPTPPPTNTPPTNTPPTDPPDDGEPDDDGSDQDSDGGNLV